MIDPTTLDFNTFQEVSTASNCVEQKSSILPTVLIIFGIVTITVGVHLYIEKHFLNSIND